MYDANFRQEHNHEELSVLNHAWDEITHISMWDLERPFRYKLIGVDNILSSSQRFQELGRPEDFSLYVLAELFRVSFCFAFLFSSSGTKWSYSHTFVLSGIMDM